MNGNPAPAWPWAAGAVVCAAFGGSPVSSALAVGLAMLFFFGGLAAGRRDATSLGARLAAWAWPFILAIGLMGLRLEGSPPVALEAIHPSRPVQMDLRIASHPELVDESWRFLSRIQAWEQGQESEAEAIRAPPLWVSLPASPEGEGLALGTSLRVRGFVARSEGARNFRPAEPGPWRVRVKSWRFVEVVSPPPAFLQPLLDLRRLCSKQLESWQDRRAAALVAALVLGQRSTLPEEWLRFFRATGLAHLLAVSGLHVGLVGTLAAALVVLLGGQGRRGRRLRWLWVALILAIYLVMVGPRPSAVRATWMGWILCAALALERPPLSVQALCLTGLAMLFWQPTQIHDLGFQLSMSATLAILVLAPRLAGSGGLGTGIGRAGAGASGRDSGDAAGAGPWKLAVAATIAAQAATLPWLLSLTATVHPLLPLMNLLAVPWLVAVLVASASALCLDLLVGLLGIDLATGGDALLRPLVTPLEVASGLPPDYWLMAVAHPPSISILGSTIPISPFFVGAGLGVGMVVGLWIVLRSGLYLRLILRALTRLIAASRGRIRRLGVGRALFLPLALLLGATLAGGASIAGCLSLQENGWGIFAGRQPTPAEAELQRSPVLRLIAPLTTAGPLAVELIALDVGQGDAVVLRWHDPSARRPWLRQFRGILVDGGGWRRGDIASRVLLPALADLGLQRLDAMVVTHGDSDHCGGLEDLLSYLPVGEVWASPAQVEGCTQQLLGRRGTRWRPLYRGERATVGPIGVEVLWPPAGYRGSGNDTSLVLLASLAGRQVLLTGDIDATVERRLLEMGEGLPGVQVLKVAHHGSKSSTSRRFLSVVRPRLAVVSAGASNNYGHPHPKVVERLKAFGIPLSRTDLGGAQRLTFPQIPSQPQAGSSAGASSTGASSAGASTTVAPEPAGAVESPSDDPP